MTRRTKILIVSILSVAVVIAAGVVILSTVAGAQPPSDDEMLGAFSEHEREFEELLDLYRADPGIDGHVNRWATDDDPWAVLSIDHDPNVARYVELRKLLKVRSVESWDESEIELIVDSYGIVSSGYIKGYAYSEHPLEPLVGSTDHLDGAEGTVYRRFSDNWYLFFDWN